ncbi:cytochrome c oxidase assembly factor CtaG [Bacillus sp. SM2101]|uniref:cytochrome c oxidase assembly factor CtaG n=1 Tax=Bacillus sp. SM2101 TaxID=2805366 RepID=UPI001BDE267E|nr:cytochrome c oxidase assembly factor CtaG [Bacillus sp. SM2101]
MDLSVFGFRALWSPYFFIWICILVTCYFLLMGPLRKKLSADSPASKKQISYFVTAMVLLYVIKGSPVDLLGHLMLSVHMVQMATLYLIIPPLLILAFPNWFYRWLLNVRYVKPVFSLFSKPLIALILFNGAFSFYHIPVIFDIVKTNSLLHAAVTIGIFIAAMLMWWPLINTLEESQSLSGIKKIGYIFADGILLTPACALIIFAQEPLYITYSDPTAWVNALKLCVPADMLSSIQLTGPELFNTLPLLEDQQLGGVLMKIIQEIVYGAILAHIFFQWAKKDREQEEKELEKYMTPQTIK